MPEAEIAQMIGRLEGALTSKLDAQGVAIRNVGDAVSKLGKRVDDLEREQEQIKRRSQQSAHDLSEHFARDEAVNEAIKAHMGKLETAVGLLGTTNDKQSRVLSRIDKLHPIIMLVAGAIGAAVGGYVHAKAAPEAPPTHLEVKP